MVYNKFAYAIANKVDYISERVAMVKLETDRKQLNFISVDAPENNIPLHETQTFYVDLRQ